jgi:hypothetical protein
VDVGRIPGGVFTPATDGARLAFRQRHAGRWRLVLVDLARGSYRVVTVAAPGATISRPALGRGHLAWTVTSPHGSALFVASADGRGTRVVARTRVGQLGAPALGAGRIAYTEEDLTGSRLVVRRLSGGAALRVLLAVRAPYGLWTTALVGRTALVTRWWRPTGEARLLRLRF